MSHFNRDTRHPQRPLLYEHVTPDRDETSSFQYKTEGILRDREVSKVHLEAVTACRDRDYMVGHN